VRASQFSLLLRASLSSNSNSEIGGIHTDHKRLILLPLYVSSKFLPGDVSGRVITPVSVYRRIGGRGGL